MKEVNKQRLYADLKRISDQIGILQEETPKLVLDRKEYHTILVNNGMSKRAGGYGQCSWHIRTIFVDAGKQSYQHRTYRRIRRTPQGVYWKLPNNGKQGYHYRLHKYSSTEHKDVKATYKTKLHCLIHELTHYRFGYMSHGKAFEKRIKEILQGRTFPKKI
jgi:hypothetical protein